MSITVSLKKPEKSVESIREFTPVHLMDEPEPPHAASASISLHKEPLEPIREITPEHILEEPAPPTREITPEHLAEEPPTTHKVTVVKTKTVATPKMVGVEDSDIVPSEHTIRTSSETNGILTGIIVVLALLVVTALAVILCTSAPPDIAESTIPATESIIEAEEALTEASTTPMEPKSLTDTFTDVFSFVWLVFSELPILQMALLISLVTTGLSFIRRAFETFRS